MVQLTSIQISDGTSGTAAGAMKALPNSKALSCVCCGLTQLLPAIVAGARKQPMKEAGAGVRDIKSSQKMCGRKENVSQRDEETFRFAFHSVKFKHIHLNGCRAWS